MSSDQGPGMTIALVRLLAVVLPLAATAIPATAADFRSATTQSGKAIVLSQPHNWASGTCRLGWTKVTILRHPDHGQLIVDEAEYKQGDFGGGRYIAGQPDDCVGRTIRGTQVRYQPNASYKGTDRMEWLMTFELIPELEVHYTIQVD